MGLFDMGMADPSGTGGLDMDTLRQLIQGKQNPFPAPDVTNPAIPMATGAPLASPNMQSPFSPEALAANAAARGIPPPPVDLTPPADVGAALTGSVPLPRVRPTAGAPLDITPAAGGAGEALAQASVGKGGLVEALKGVKAPTAPEIQKISTPAAPRVSTAIKSGDLMALLQALNAAPGAGGLKLPSTLGQALGK